MNDHIEDNESSEIMGNTDFFKIDKWFLHFHKFFYKIDRVLQIVK
jgi:hypothetical protein